MVVYSIEDLPSKYKCPICWGALKNPVMVKTELGCEHKFCISCIQPWTNKSNICPFDNSPVEGFEPLDPSFMNEYSELMNQIQLKCYFDGCSFAARVEQIEAHISVCDHNPEAKKPCVHDCGASIKNKELPNHNCIEYLKGENTKLQQGHRVQIRRYQNENCKLLRRLQLSHQENRELKMELNDAERATKAARIKKVRCNNQLMKTEKIVAKLELDLELANDKIKLFMAGARATGGTSDDFLGDDDDDLFEESYEAAEQSPERPFIGKTLCEYFADRFLARIEQVTIEQTNQHWDWELHLDEFYSELE